MSAAVAAIDAYQRWLSPLKGYRCAHDVLYGHGGCSGFGKRAFARHPNLFAFALLRRRFQQCREAYTVLMAVDEERRRRRREWLGEASDCVDPCDAANCGVSAFELGACDASACDIGACAAS